MDDANQLLVWEVDAGSRGVYGVTDGTQGHAERRMLQALETVEGGRGRVRRARLKLDRNGTAVYAYGETLLTVRLGQRVFTRANSDRWWRS